MLALGITIGCLISVILFWSGFYFSQRYFSSDAYYKGTPMQLPVIGRRQVKRKPKSISDEEQWRREQKQAPLDPGL